MADQLHLDFETRSELDLSVRGLDNYARHGSTLTLMLAWAVNDQTVKLWQPHREPRMPAEIREALEDPWVTKAGWNATFERNILKYRHNIWVPYQEWRDPMVHARHLSMPGSLDDVGRILGLKQDEAKMDEGSRLIKLFCEPAVEASDGGLFGSQPASFRDWNTNPADWELFCDYCKRDVVAERAIAKKMAKFPLPESEQRLWELDQEINNRGLPVNLSVVKGARHVTEIEMARLKKKLKELTGLANPNSNDQMLAWAQKQGYPFGALGKPLVARAFAGEGEMSPLCREVLEIRMMTSKSAVHKFTAIADNVTVDARLRHQFVFCGASRSGRFSGRDCQPQNFPRPTKEVDSKMERAIELLQSADYEAIVREFTSPLDVVTSCTRSCICAPDGYRLIWADLGAIENRVLGELAGCDGILRVFREGLDPYKDFATALYNKPYDEVTKEERQHSKPAVLGCGYQLSGGEEVESSAGDLTKGGLWGYAAALGCELTREEAHLSVAVFRAKFPEVVNLWRDTEEAAIDAVRTGEERKVGHLLFRPVGSKMLQVVLPSGRPLNYINPIAERVELTSQDGSKYKKWAVTYEGVNQATRQWSRTKTYGGKWVENCLAGDTLVLAQRGWIPIATVQKVDKVWDGVDWVQHGGLINQGVQEVGEWAGICLTRSHLILAGSRYTQAGLMDGGSAELALSLGRDLVPAQFYLRLLAKRGEQSFSAIAENSSTAEPSRSQRVGSKLATVARCWLPGSGGWRRAATMSSQTTTSATCGCTGVLASSPAATNPRARRTTTTVPAVSRCTSRGATTPQNGCATPSLSPIGTNSTPTWTESTMMATTSRATSASWIGRRIQTIGAILSCSLSKAKRCLTPSSESDSPLFGRETTSSSTSKAERQSKKPWSFTGTREVFDLLNCGPRNRFAVMTSGGPVIVHNCTQAVARDILAHGMVAAASRGMEIVGHVHDEVICQVPDDSPLTHKDLEDCMTQAPPWFPQILLTAEGTTAKHYSK